MEKYTDVVISLSGRPVPGATVTVKDANGANATIYSDNGSTTTTNPFTTGASGAIGFYAANGNYVINVTAPNSTSTSTTPVILFDPDESPFISDGT